MCLRVVSPCITGMLISSVMTSTLGLWPRTTMRPGHLGNPDNFNIRVRLQHSLQLPGKKRGSPRSGLLVGARKPVISGASSRAAHLEVPGRRNSSLSKTRSSSSPAGTLAKSSPHHQPSPNSTPSANRGGQALIAAASYFQQHVLPGLFNAYGARLS